MRIQWPYKVGVAALIFVTAIAMHSGTSQAYTVEDVEQRHAAVAMQMDTAYRESGSRVDIAGFDLDEAKRQNRKVPANIVSEVVKADKELRAQWRALENERIGIVTRIGRLMNTNAGNLLSVENLSDSDAGEADWFALRNAAIILPDKQRIEISPRDFKGGSYRDSYSYQCEPAAMVAVYGRQSTSHTARATIDFKTKPLNALLEISGLDQDKPGRTPVRFSINGVEVTRGPNEFQKVGWSEKRYSIPDAAWNAVIKRESTDDVYKSIEEWKSRIDAFGASSSQRATSIDNLTATYRRDLVWKKRNYPTDWWKSSFVRGLCYETDSTLGPDHNRPWFLDNKEYIAKAFDAAGVNLIYNYPGGDYEALGVRQYTEIARHNDPIGTPLIEVHWPTAHPESSSGKLNPPARLYADVDAAHKDLNTYLTRIATGGNQSSTIRGLSVDEPRIEDSYRFEDVPEIMVAYREYLQRRKPVLDKFGVTIDPAAPPVVTVTKESDMPAWMEWQYFKMEFVAKFYAKFSQKMNDQNRIALVVAQDYLNYNPQVAPYPAYGANLPLISTDLYNNAGINEAFGMDLLRSVSTGKALLVNGAGYSARNPSRFHRTLANSMLRADGVVTWIYTYASKYRYRYFFLRPHMLDDRGRSLLDSWKPEYWDILDKTYLGMKKGEVYLTNTTSTAQIGVLYSMRSVIANSAEGAALSSQVQRNALYTFNALQDVHRSVEACMLEGLTPEKLKRYRVLYLIDGQALTAEESARLRNWVNAGGTLVVSGRTGLKDEWGRTLPDYALADIMGVQYKSRQSGQTGFQLNAAKLYSGSIAYNPQFTYAEVKPTSAKVLASWANGSPALLHNTVGKGHTYTITADRPGEYLCDSVPQSGRYHWEQPGFPELFSSIAKAHVTSEPIKIVGAPADMEVQVRRKGKAWIVQLLDWRDNRTVKNVKLAINLPGNWKVSYPLDGKAAGEIKTGKPATLRPVSIHDIIVLEPVTKVQEKTIAMVKRSSTKPKVVPVAGNFRKHVD